MKKTPTLTKRGRGRPRKNGTGREETMIGLPPELRRDLDRYVLHLRVKAPGVGRGDVVSKALRAYRPFRLWGLRDRT